MDQSSAEKIGEPMTFTRLLTSVVAVAVVGLLAVGAVSYIFTGSPVTLTAPSSATDARIHLSRRGVTDLGFGARPLAFDYGPTGRGQPLLVMRRLEGHAAVPSEPDTMRDLALALREIRGTDPGRVDSVFAKYGWRVEFP